jgi:hypothetical protein
MEAAMTKTAEMTEDENLETLCADEFKALGFMARSSDVAAIADALRAQGAEYGEVGIMAACVGYAAAKGLRF